MGWAETRHARGASYVPPVSDPPSMVPPDALVGVMRPRTGVLQLRRAHESEESELRCPHCDGSLILDDAPVDVTDSPPAHEGCAPA